MYKIVLKTLFILRNFLDPLCRFQEVSILCYHSISHDLVETAITPEQFKAHLELLKNKGYSLVSLKEIVAWYDSEMGGNTFPRKAVALTFDDGYADFKAVVVPILEEQRIPAALFIVGDGEKYARTLKTDIAMLTKSDTAGLSKHPLIEIGWHTATHPNLAACDTDMLLYECTPPAPMSFIAYPGGNYSDTAIEAVKKTGFSAAFSIKRDLVSRGKSRWLLPRLVVLKSDTVADVVQYVSMAQHWYAVMRSFFKKYV